MSEKPVRTFVAVELDDLVRQGLSEVQDKLQRQLGNRWVRWVRPEGIHLTLNFLGNVPAGRLDAIEEALAHACRGLGPSVVRPGGLGCFPNPRRPRVVWVGLTGDVPALLALQKATTRALEDLGFSPESRAYSPHLTLGRVRQEVSGGDRAVIGTCVEKTATLHLNAIRVETVSLMRSDLSPQGAQYHRLAGFPLESSPNCGILEHPRGE
jgi:2'-5' RNA ligase